MEIGVPVVKVGKPGSASCETYSMQSLWSKGSTMAGDHGGYDTHEEIRNIVIWSFKALATGKWPLHNWDGSEFRALPNSRISIPLGRLITLVSLSSCPMRSLPTPTSTIPAGFGNCSWATRQPQGNGLPFGMN